MQPVQDCSLLAAELSLHTVSESESQTDAMRLVSNPASQRTSRTRAAVYPRNSAVQCCTDDKQSFASFCPAMSCICEYCAVGKQYSTVQYKYRQVEIVIILRYCSHKEGRYLPRGSIPHQEGGEKNEGLKGGSVALMRSSAAVFESFASFGISEGRRHRMEAKKRNQFAIRL